MISRKLLSEAKAFDERILERVEHGLVPDLQYAANVDWFFNNPWRRPAYVDMIFGDYLRFALKHLTDHKLKILEIGSGLGHMCIELARRGHEVTGIELSPESVRIANEYYARCPKGNDFGRIQYFNDDLMNWHPQEKFDCACFFLTLHHFEDPRTVLKKVNSFLRKDGKIIVIEPARDLFSFRNAAIVALIRTLLSFNQNWHAPVEPSDSQLAFRQLTTGVLNEYREARDSNEKEQSPNDNSTFASHMLKALDDDYHKIELSFGNTISPRLLGGIRGKTEEETLKIAKFIKLFDDFATSEKLIEPGVIYYAGKLK